MSGVDISAEAVERLAMYAEQLCADTDMAGTLRALSAALAEARRVPEHFCASADDADAAIRGINCLMDTEVWHMREQRDAERARRERAEAALRAAFAMRVTNHPEWEAIARAALAQEAGTDGR